MTVDHDPAGGRPPQAGSVTIASTSLRLRDVALHLVRTGLESADPRAGVERHLAYDGRILNAGGRQFDLAKYPAVWLIGAGKASWPVADAVAGLLRERLSGGLVVVQRGAGLAIPGIDVLESDHPLPSTDSLVAGKRLLELCKRVGPDDLVIATFTGGSSALACVPADGVSFEAKRDVHRRLLASGAPIEDINAVRKHLSMVKGGRLAHVASGATLLNLTLPDVTSGRLDCITDPTVADESTAADAIEVLTSRGLWDHVDACVRTHLSGPSAESPDLRGRDISTVLLTDGDRACAAMAAAAREQGFEPRVFGTQIAGEASTVGRMLATMAVESACQGRPFSAPCALIGAGGEVVVSLDGGAAEDALGGPNQETALAFAVTLPRSPLDVAAVFVDSDGSDGGTPHAGAVVDGDTRRRAAVLGVDLSAALLRHDSSGAFQELGDLVSTGPTLTNISDLWAVVVAPTESRT